LPFPNWALVDLIRFEVFGLLGQRMPTLFTCERPIPMTFDGLFEARPIGGSLLIVAQALVLVGLALFAAMFYATNRRFRSVYLQQARRFSDCRLTGKEAVGRLLEHLGLSSDCIDDGATIDHYDDLRRRVRLRTESSVSSSVAALAIAAHEVGHAEQFATGYWAARATRGLRVVLALSAVVLLVYPFVATIQFSDDISLWSLIALLAIVPILRLPVAMALERDATRRAKRLLNETGLAHENEQQGIAHFLQAALFTHLALGTGLVLLIGGCAGLMWLIETALDAQPLSMPVAAWGLFQPNGPLPQIEVIHLDGMSIFPPVASAVTLAWLWWVFRNRRHKAPVRCAADANNEGMARFQAGDALGAITLIDEALRLDPGLGTAHYNRAVVLASQARHLEALASIETMFGCRPEEVEPLLCTADPWFLRGMLRLENSDYLGAIDDLSRAYTLNPSDPAMLLRSRGLALIKLGQLDRALVDTNDALALAPDDAIAYNNRGVIYRDLGNLEQAESDLRRAIEIDPQLPNPREHLAALGETTGASRELQPSI
jgi:Zn-dependent membrane protease YugP/Flp pilus assembly protein TadD